jgi:hypothetical protein
MSYDQYIGSVLFGDQLNRLLGSIPLIKFMHNDDKHYGMQYKSGMNHDIRPFDSITCSGGGIYFTTIEYWESHVWTYGDSGREVQIPDNAYVYIESHGKLKCSHIWLGDREEKFKLIHRLFDQYIKKSNSHDSNFDIVHRILSINIQSINHIDPVYLRIDTMIKIIKKCGNHLEMIVKIFDPLKLPRELLILAVKQNGLALKFIPRESRTLEILLYAVRQNGMALEYIDPLDQPYVIQMEALRQTGHCIKYIDYRARKRDMFKQALKTPGTLKYLGNYSD